MICYQYRQSNVNISLLSVPADKKSYAVGIFNKEVLNRITSANKSFHVDATFKTCPRNFQQLLNFGVQFDGKMFLAFSVAMSNKNSDLYEQTLEKIAEQCPAINPEMIHSDYEKAMFNACNKVFPNAEQKGCLWHYDHAVTRRLRKIGKH